jgi:hypothetical protein
VLVNARLPRFLLVGGLLLSGLSVRPSSNSRRRRLRLQGQQRRPTSRLPLELRTSTSRRGVSPLYARRRRAPPILPSGAALVKLPSARCYAYRRHLLVLLGDGIPTASSSAGGLSTSSLVAAASSSRTSPPMCSLPQCCSRGDLCKEREEDCVVRRAPTVRG